MIQCFRTADDDCDMDSRLARSSKVPVLATHFSKSPTRTTFQKWQILVGRDDDFPRMILKWRYPSTVWDGNPVLGFMAESDFTDGQGKPLQEVRFADVKPMWSYPPTAVSSNYDSIAFGMGASHLRKDPPHAKDALTAQSPIVVVKAATVLQSFGIIASRILLQFSDTQGVKKNRAYCPMTWNYAYEYDAPARYSDLLREQGAPALLAHECVLSVIAQMSNKDQKHAQCADARSPNAVTSGVMISLTPVYPQRVPRPVTLDSPIEFQNVKHTRAVLNQTLSNADDFVEVPKV